MGWDVFVIFGFKPAKQLYRILIRLRNIKTNKLYPDPTVFLESRNTDWGSNHQQKWDESELPSIVFQIFFLRQRGRHESMKGFFFKRGCKKHQCLWNANIMAWNHFHNWTTKKYNSNTNTMRLRRHFTANLEHPWNIYLKQQYECCF